MDAATSILTHDKDVLRRLAERKAEIASDPINAERRTAWLYRSLSMWLSRQLTRRRRVLQRIFAKLLLVAPNRSYVAPTTEWTGTSPLIISRSAAIITKKESAAHPGRSGPVFRN